MQMYKKEIWKDITNYEGIYQVSNLGRLKSFDRFDVAGRRITEYGYEVLPIRIHFELNNGLSNNL